MPFKDSKKKRVISSGIRLRTFNYIVIAFALVITSVLLYTVFEGRVMYESLKSSIDQFITCHQCAEDIQKASDYLTQEVREFAVTGNITHVNNYFTEALVNKRRENAIDTLSRFDDAASQEEFMLSAVELSHELMDREYYSMRLVMDAKGISVNEYPSALRRTTLTDDDQALSPDEKLERAEQMLFDDEYHSYKNRINQNFSRYTEKLLVAVRAREQEGFARYARLQTLQRALIVLFVVMLVAILIVTSFLIVFPLRRNAALVMRHKKMKVSGAHEMRVFATYYNLAVEKNRIHQDQLRYDATHDSLTDTNNRSVFEEMLKSALDTPEMALLLVDVDHFKQVNDENGHNMGDRVLQTVAAVLKRSFRTDDTICRIGGDEFTVIVSGIVAEHGQQLVDKMRVVSERLRHPDEPGLPSITLSVGIAFGNEQLSFKELYENADSALYQAKENGRDCVQVFR